MFFKSPTSVGCAESNVDQIVFKEFFGEHPGNLIEIGAARPNWLSIGAFYRANKWDVLSIEPNPTFAQMHRDVGHDVLEFACGSEDKDCVDFTIVDSEGAKYRDGQVSYESWSSLSIRDEYADIFPGLETRNIEVKQRKLDTLISQFRSDWQNIDIICVDVEGWELEAISGLDFNKFKPKVIIIENLFYKQSYRAFMKARGYKLWKILAPNEIYIRNENKKKPPAITLSLQTSCGRLRCFLGSLKRRVKQRYLPPLTSLLRR